MFGREEERKEAYEKNLSDYEQSAVKANIWNAVMPPVYRMISMGGILFILYFGQKNVLGSGWNKWDIAAFTTFLACFVKLSVKSSSAAKLFNAVHKAEISWKRIRPLMKQHGTQSGEKWVESCELEVANLTFAYPDGKTVLKDISFTANTGQIIGITGSVACGKSTLGKVFLGEYPYEGRILLNGEELREKTSSERTGSIGYLGHDPELFNDTIENNILMGDSADVERYLQMVCLDGEVSEMEKGLQTLVGNGGVRLSGGQAQRLALARTLCHRRPLLILDDPFSALDKKTEREIFYKLRKNSPAATILLISHRLYLFPEMDQVIWMGDGKATVSDHETLMKQVPEYAKLFTEQEEGAHHEA